MGTLIAAKTVVVADDTAFVRDRFTTAIDGSGHRAIGARTAADVLDVLRDEPAVDLVIVDLRLPDAGGLDLLRQISGASAQPPKVVVFSGTIVNADEARDLPALGVVGYINEYMAAQHIVPSLGPHLFPENYNRRSSPRVAFSAPVSYRVGNAVTAATTLNVSKGGLAVRTTQPLDAGTDLKVRFRLPAGRHDIEADACVAWSDRRVGMGLRFTRIASGDETAIGAFVESHFFSNRRA